MVQVKGLPPCAGEASGGSSCVDKFYLCEKEGLATLADLCMQPVHTPGGNADKNNLSHSHLWDNIETLSQCTVNVARSCYLVCKCYVEIDMYSRNSNPRDSSVFLWKQLQGFINFFEKGGNHPMPPPTGLPMF